ncbi:MULTISPECIES: dephospho-CoA kinase [unclassified Gilliamella]|uniref:dephospho-CoA kinase n=1 Tax=unclassified Gilliamella TaxID=2685620 RepID=UPI00226A9DAF|nr:MULTISPECIES: dephospho-CoA kinase [unclassified Gilliamella]MCX8601936.1 dephospho-CoA kinase [Gilliamella sp. B3722]MCX8608077.1 dephospho-CoA kinase [Gilliamella sp. B3771]MCX8611204.1 dephospho-CoA kinase [Gilliamella sp. B3891]MCX8613672.1 dephospho-CoA kinase [Gilliamella sp. B3773]MCX8615037.1 dephospho-CoA kinase [Gilliamella sp. B3770]
MPYVVALSGGVASGKSTIANLFAQLGVPIIDADIIARQVVEVGTDALAQIVKHFSTEILLPNGELDRSQLREIIFNNDHERLWLNNLLHPIIHQITQKQIAKQTAPYVIWVVPLLIENNLHQLADRVLMVDVPETLQMERLIYRDKISESLAKRMIRTQVPLAERLSYADDIIVNNGNLASLSEQVNKLHQQYLNNFKIKNNKYE